MLGTTDGPDQAAHPAPQSWQSWGDTAQSLSYLFIKLRPLIHWPSELTGDGAEETDWPPDQSRQCCREEQRQWRSQAGIWLNCKSWLSHIILLVIVNEGVQTIAALKSGICSHLTNKSQWEIKHTFVCKCVIQLFFVLYTRWMTLFFFFSHKTYLLFGLFPSGLFGSE